MNEMSIAENLEKIKSELKNATLVVVSKYQTEAQILEAYNAGQRIFGESKIQAMSQKYNALPKDIQWHMIGHTQTNKVKYMADYVSLIHSVDSLRLLVEIDKQAQKHERIIDFLFQIRIAQEDTKHGISEVQMNEILTSEIYLSLKNIRLRGVMGIATNTSNIEQIQSEFTQLKSVFDRLKKSAHSNQIDILSMGMSGDYPLAISAGSTMVRIGSAVFQ